MRARDASGFVLVLVLAMLVVLSLLAGGIAATTARLRDHAEDRQRDLQDQVDMASTKATLYYLLSTQPMTIGGLTVDNRFAAIRARAEAEGLDFNFSVAPTRNEIALDGRVYRGLGDTRFAVQDDSGLFGIKLQPPEALARLIAAHSGKSSVPPSVLIARLMDYQDQDDLYRLNSMEREGYAKLGLPPPSNLPLVTPMELLRIPGWREALAGMSGRGINATITTEATTLINVNTAPLGALMTLQGVDAAMAERVVARRKLQPFMTGMDFYEFLGLASPFEPAIRLYPLTSGTLRLWGSRGGQVQLVHWKLTPGDDGGRPWREDYELIDSQDSRLDDAAAQVGSRLFAKPVAAPR